MAARKDDPLRGDWDRFIEESAPHWAPLFRYCLKLTRNPFDADDLVSETLIKTFGSRAFTTDNLESPLAFMLRVASRTWVDEQRKRRWVTDTRLEDGTAPDPRDVGAIRDAAGALYDHLSPIQRAVFILKEVFDMNHTEIAKILSISPENSRVTLHRSKKIMDNPVRREPRASRELVQRFVTSFMSGDIEDVKTLLLDDVESYAFPMGRELRAKDDLRWLKVAMSKATPDLQVRDVLGDQAILVFRNENTNEKALEEVWLLEESGGKIARIIGYGVPLLVSWVARHCQVPWRDARFRYDLSQSPAN